MRLDNKVAIVTGCARGLGKAIALRFAKEGAKLVICDILDCKPVAKKIEALGGEALVLRMDITDEKADIEMAEKTVDRFGRIDILVNDAAALGGIGRTNFIKPLEQLTPEDWDEFLGVNVKGTFLCCKSVIPYMKKQKKGTIVNISSTTGFSGLPAFLHYSSSKGAVITMTRGMAQVLGEYNINVNSIGPGLVMTETVAAAFSKELNDQHIKLHQYLHKPVQPEDIAAATLFLASDEASIITGQTLLVNGGEYLH